MADAAITVDVAKPRDVLGQLTAKLPFDDVIFVEQGGDTRDFVLVHLAGLGLRVDAGLVSELASDTWTDAVKVLQRDHRRPVGRDVDAHDTRHKYKTPGGLSGGA